MSILDPLGHILTSAYHKTTSVLEKGASTIEHGVSDIFDSVKKEAQSDLNQAQQALSTAVQSAEYAIVRGEVAKDAQKFRRLVEQFRADADKFADLGGVLAKRDADAAKQAIQQALSEAPAVMQEVERLASKELFSLTFEVGGQADLGVGLDGAVGFAVAVPNITKIKGYATVGLTIGAEEGGDAAVAIGMSPQEPDDQSGPFAAIVLSADFVAGGGVSGSMNLPDPSFGGISMALEAGEEFQVAGGAGYTFAL